MTFVSASFSILAWRSLCAAALVACILSLFVIGTASAGERGRRVALVVGNTEYRNVERLKNGAGDAEAIGRTLSSLGFEVIERSNATRQEFNATLDKFYAASADADAAVVFYSGHGFQIGGINYLVPVDATLRDRTRIEAETIRLDDIVERTQSLKRPTLVFLDACRNNPLPESIRSQSAGEGLAELGTGSGTFIAFATKPGEVARDGNGAHSPFTAALLEQLPTPGISISDMMINVRNSVETAMLHNQTPWDQSSLRRQFYFNPVERAVETASTATVSRPDAVDIAISILPADDGATVDRQPVAIASVQTDAPISIEPGATTISIGAVETPDAAERADGGIDTPKDEAKPAGVKSAPQSETAAVDTGRTAPEASSSAVPAGSANRVAVAQGGSQSGAQGSAVQAGQVVKPAAGQALPLSHEDSSLVSAASTAAGSVLVAALEPRKLGQAPQSGIRAAIAGETSTPLEKPTDRPYQVASVSTERSVAIGPAPARRLPPVRANGPRIVGVDITPPPVTDEPSVQVASIDPTLPGPGALTATPVPPEPPTLPDVPDDLPRAVLGELKRIGCFTGKVGSTWDKASKRALNAYYNAKDVKPESDDPTSELYARLTEEDDKVCLPPKVVNEPKPPKTVREPTKIVREPPKTVREPPKIVKVPQRVAPPKPPVVAQDKPKKQITIGGSVFR